MADKSKTQAVKRKAAPAAKEATPAKKSKNKPRNYNLGNGIYRFSKSRMYHKKALYKFIGKKTPKTVSMPVCNYLTSPYTYWAITYACQIV
jgi:large subunit ribosomal protein L6e